MKSCYKHKWNDAARKRWNQRDPGLWSKPRASFVWYSPESWVQTFQTGCYSQTRQEARRYLSSDSHEQWTIPKPYSQPPGVQTVDEHWPFTEPKVTCGCLYCPVWKQMPPSCLNLQFTLGLRSRPLQKGIQVLCWCQTLYIDVFLPDTNLSVSIPWVSSSSSHTSVNVLSSMSAEGGVMDIRGCESFFSVHVLKQNYT